MGNTKWIYLFNEVDQALNYIGGAWDDVVGLLGGKGANLAEMARMNVPVPHGFTITTEACKEFINLGGIYPKGLMRQGEHAMNYLETATGKKFGCKKNPLLVSCRSGAKISMPGMMDTVLNIGLNDETVEGMIALTGNERFVYDSYRRLIQMFGTVVVGMPDEAFEEIISEKKLAAKVKTDSDLTADHWKDVTEQFKKIFKRLASFEFPMNPGRQLVLATEAVFKSWNGKRAVAYRHAAGIPDDLGTAVNIVTMVFGNMGENSATGVAMTRNGSTGEKKIEGDYLINAQGEDVVAGTRMTKDISKLKDEMPEVYTEFEQIVKRLEKHYGEMQDVEFTIEKGKLWMLQTRTGKRTAQSAVRIAVDMANEELITRKEAVLHVHPDQIDFFMHPQFEIESRLEAENAGRLIASGINVSPGAAVGVVALDADLAEEWGR